MDKPTPRALAGARRIRRNVADWYADRIDHPTFSARNARIWDGIARRDDLHDGVLLCLRENIGT